MKKIFFLILLFISSFYWSQSDLDIDQQQVYTHLYSKEIEKAKYLIITKFINSKNSSKRIIGYVYLSDYYSFTENEVEKVRSLERAEKLAVQTKKDRDMGYVKLGYARYYQSLNKNDLFIKSLNNAIHIFSKYADENFILSQLYFLKYNYKSKNSLEQDVRQDGIYTNEYAIRSKNNILINFSYSNLGYYYKNKFNETQDSQYLDSAAISYKNSLKYISLIKDPKAKKRSQIVYYLNYGSLLNSMAPDNYNTCLELYDKVLKISEKDHTFKDITALTYNNIGSAYENLKKIDLAENYYTKAYALTKNDSTIFTIHKLVVLNNLSRIYEEKKQFVKALNLEREAKELIKEDNKKQFTNNTKALEIYYKTEQKNQHIKQLKEKNDNFEKQRFYFISIIILAVCGALFLFFMLRFKLKINKQKTNLLEAAKNKTELILKLEKEERARLAAEQELLTVQQEQLQKKALATSLHLDYKNSFIRDIKEKLIKNSSADFEKILKEDQLNDHDFYEIENIIEEIHPNFFKRLKEQAKTKLSPLDLKYASYIYLNMDNQQISNVLKADPKTVRVTKYRLKLKLGLTKDDSLQNFLQNLTLT